MDLSARFSQRRWGIPLLLVILLASLGLKLHHLGHPAITYWDESFHALVARNLLKHPLKFTLIDQPWLPYDYKDWSGNHIWLHKPPLPMWGIAFSYALLGIHAFALRLPSLLLSSSAVLLTYLIGTELYDRRVGLIAAFWQAFNACTYRLVHGYLFSDHIDIALLFWLEVSCYLLLRALRSAHPREHVLCGITQGLAYLSKSYLGLLAFGIALPMAILARLRLLRLPAPLRLRHLGIQLAAALITVAPWSLYAFAKYPKEFLHENWHVLAHLTTDIESWAATWDRPLFDYMLLVVPVIYSGVLVSTLRIGYDFLRRRTWEDAFLLIWIVAVVLPHSLAKTKTPSATLIGMPALVMAFSVVIGRGLSDSRYMAFWLAAGIVLIFFPGGENLVKGRDQFDQIEAFAPYLMTNRWILWRVLGGIAIGILGSWALELVRRWRWGTFIPKAAMLTALTLTVILGVRSVQESLRIVQINAADTTYLRLGHAIDRQFPDKACFFLDDPVSGSHQRLMFYADRTVYPLGERDLTADAAQVREKGGIPYLITRGEREGKPVLDHHAETGFRIYRLD